MSKRAGRLFFVLLTLTLTFAIGSATAEGGDQGNAATVESLQKRILADPQLSERVHALRDDPQVREILSDPAISEALNKGDFGALLANPKIQRLADNPAVQTLTRDVAPAR